MLKSQGNVRKNGFFIVPLNSLFLVIFCLCVNMHNMVCVFKYTVHVCVCVCTCAFVCVCVCVCMCVCVTELQLGLARKRLAETAQSAPCSLCACASPRRCFCCQPQPQNILPSCWTKAPAGVHNYNLWGKQVVGGDVAFWDVCGLVWDLSRQEAGWTTWVSRIAGAAQGHNLHISAHLLCLLWSTHWIHFQMSGQLRGGGGGGGRGGEEGGWPLLGTWGGQVKVFEARMDDQWSSYQWVES